MHLYHWNNVKALNTGPDENGDIIVIASSLEGARKKAARNFRAWLQDAIFIRNHGEELDNDALSQIEFLVAKLERDLKQMPIVGKTEVYIWGSK